MSNSQITGIIYSKFHVKLGPVAVAWMPLNLPIDKDMVSMKSINLIIGEREIIPKSLSIVSFPSINMRGLVKSLGINNKHERGDRIDGTITLLFDNDSDTSVFYKYINEFEKIFDDIATKIANLEEYEGHNPKQIKKELEIFHTDILNIVNELTEGSAILPLEDLFHFENNQIKEVKEDGEK